MKDHKKLRPWSERSLQILNNSKKRNKCLTEVLEDLLEQRFSSDQVRLRRVTQELEAAQDQSKELNNRLGLEAVAKEKLTTTI